MTVREIPLSQGLVALVDECDFERVMQFKWYANRDNNTFYARRCYREDGKSKTVILHRFILDAAPGLLVDHVDGNGLDNRRLNIRIATLSQNARNCRIPVTNTSGYRGIYARKGGWAASIRVNKVIFIGQFDTPIEAAIAYDEQARLLHGEFARLNFPDLSKNERAAA